MRKLQRKWVGLGLVALLLGLGIWTWKHRSGQDLEPGPTSDKESLQADADLHGLADHPAELHSAGSSPTLRSNLEDPVASGTPEDTVEKNWTVSGHLRLGKTGVLPNTTLQLSLYKGRTAKGATLAHTYLSTDAQGHFSWTSLAPSQTVTLKALPVVENHRVGTDVRTVVFGDAPPTDLEPYAYALDCEVVGQVVDEDRVGLPDVIVSCTMNEARTDRLGHFRVPITTAMGQTTFQVFSPGYAPGDFGVADLKVGENSVPTVVLKRGFSLRGTVQSEAGLPLEGAEVSSYPPHHTRTTSDARGQFEMRGLDREARRVPIMASKDGYVQNTKTVRRPKEGWSELEDPVVVLASGTTVQGWVVDETGQPIPDAWVNFGVHPSQSGQRGAQGDFSDERGAFTLAPLKPGVHSVWASRTGFAPSYALVEIPSPVADAEGVQVVLSEGHKFWGQVLDEAGQPMPGVLLFPQAKDEFERDSDTWVTGGASTDREGRFEFPNARYPVIALQVFAEGHAALNQDILAGEETRLYPKPAGELQGLVIDAHSGAPIESFVVRFLPAKLQPGEVGLSGASAGWTKPGMAFRHHDGTWSTGKETLPASTITQVEVSAPGYATARIKRVVVRAKGALDPLKIALQPE